MRGWCNWWVNNVLSPFGRNDIAGLTLDVTSQAGYMVLKTPWTGREKKRIREKKGDIVTKRK